MNRFLGDSPLRVAIKLIIVSFVVGLLMNAFGISPYDFVYWARELALGIWYRGFDAIDSFVAYFLLGAAVVLPIFIVIRLLSWRRTP